MKILLLTETLEPGGAENFVVRLANALSAANDVMLVVLHSDRIHPALRSLVQHQVAVAAFDLPAKSLLWRLDSLLRKLGSGRSLVHGLLRRRLRRLVGLEAPDLIHSHLFHADRIASDVVRASPRCPAHVVTVHGDYAAYLDGSADPRIRQFRRHARGIVANADAIVGVAREHLLFFREHFPLAAGKLHFVYNGYAPPPAPVPSPSRESLGLGEGEFLFGMVSRGVEKKGWREAVAAFQLLGRPKTALVLVGEGPEIERIRRDGPPPRVILAGFSASPLEFIRHFDACLLPTRFAHESLPTAIVEYLYCSKPVIATGVGEIPEMIANPEGRAAGLLVGFRDEGIDVDELAGKMAQLVDDPALRSQLANAAGRAFTKFEMARCVEAYAKLYRQAVTGRRPGRLSARAIAEGSVRR